MAEIKTEGIILKITPYKDHHRILQAFTPSIGMLSLFARTVSRPNLQSLLSPLSQLELILYKKTSDLHLFKEGFLLQNHHFLRTRYSLLEAAGKLTQALLKTQLPGKTSPPLYFLLLACLKNLPHFQDPSTLITLFYLKLLTYEGLLSWDSPASFPLPTPSWPTLSALAHTRSFRPFYSVTGLDQTAILLEKELG